MAHTKGGDVGSTIGSTAPKELPPVAPKPSGHVRRVGNLADNGNAEAYPVGPRDSGGMGSSGTGGGTGPGGPMPDIPGMSGAKRAPAPPSSGFDLRQVLNGATLKKIIGLPSALADVILGKIAKPGGGTAYGIANDRSDVYIGFKDIISGAFGIGRLFSPNSAFWRLPKNDDSVMVLKPSEADGTGIPYVLYGDGGKKNNVPAWLDKDNSGIATTETIHLESGNKVIIKGGSQALSQNGADDAFTCTITMDGTKGSITISGGVNADANVNINANAGANIILNGGTLNVARKTDPVRTFIPANTVVVSVSGGVGTMNPSPIQCDGTIQDGAPFVKA